MALLDAAVCRYVDPAAAAYRGLRQVLAFAYAADLLPDLMAAGEDPIVGRGGTWHASTLPTS